MDKIEKTREYNKMYQEANKDKIKAKMCAKEDCPFCLKQVQHQWMSKHQNSKLCEKKRKLLNRIRNEIENI